MRVSRNTHDFCVYISEFFNSITECYDLRWANKRTKKRKTHCVFISDATRCTLLQSCGKVMFSQVCAILSGEGVCMTGAGPFWGCAWLVSGPSVGRGVHTWSQVSWGGGVCPGGEYVWEGRYKRG